MHAVKLWNMPHMQVFVWQFYDRVIILYMYMCVVTCEQANVWNDIPQFY